MLTKRSRTVVLFSVIGSMVAGAGSSRAQSVQQLIVVPTLANDHQFDLDYTIAHLEALLDRIKPDAILVDDYSDWLAKGCLWQATSPENHLALRYATAAGIPIFGTFLRTAPTAYDGAMRTEEQYRTLSIDDAREPFRPRLDRTAAAIARDYSFAVPPARLDRLLSGGAIPDPVDRRCAGAVSPASRSHSGGDRAGLFVRRSTGASRPPPERRSNTGPCRSTMRGSRFARVSIAQRRRSRGTIRSPFHRRVSTAS